MSLRPHHCLRSQAATNWRPGWFLVLSLSEVRGDTPSPQIPSIFEPQSTPAQSIFRLSMNAEMLSRASVGSREQFERWVREQATEAQPLDALSARRHIFESTSGLDCHTVSGTVANGRFGPDLTHVKSRETPAAGAATSTHENSRGPIQDSDTIKPGSLMPAMKVNV